MAHDVVIYCLSYHYLMGLNETSLCMFLWASLFVINGLMLYSTFIWSYISYDKIGF